MDLDFVARLDKMRVLDVKPQHHTFDLPNAKLIVPGHPESSVLLHRMSTRGQGYMPPLATNRIDREAVKMMTEWIAQLQPEDAQPPILPEGAKLEKVWSEGEFTEGPAYGPDGCIYFSDIGNRIMKYDPKTGKTVEYRNPSGRANGLDFDAQGRLIAAEGANTGGNRRITITEKDGTIRVLADGWKGKRFNSPNDLTIDTKGRIYFTDPRYVGDEKREIDTESVYRVDPDGTVTQIITDVQKPNGIILSPDMKTLYLVDHNPKGNQHLARLSAAGRWHGRRQESPPRLRQRPRHRRHDHRYPGQHLRRRGRRQNRRHLDLQSQGPKDRFRPCSRDTLELRVW